MRPDLNHFVGPRSEAGDIPPRLRALPAELPPPYDWAEFRRRERARFDHHKRPIVKWSHAAAAAGLTLFVAAMAMLSRADRHESSVDEPELTAGRTAPAATGSEAPQPQGAGVSALNEHANVAANAAAMAATRQWLAQQPPEPAVVRVGPRLAVANLEDRIAWVDDVLSDEQAEGANQDSVQALQQERATLVNLLAQVRYAEVLAADLY